MPPAWMPTRPILKSCLALVAAQKFACCGRGSGICVKFLGPMRAIEDRLRWEVVRLWEETGSIREAAARARVSYGAARRWINRHSKTGGVEQQPKNGPKRALDKAGEEKARELLLSGTWRGATAVGRELHRQGLASRPLHASTVIRAAKKAAASRGLPMRAYRGKPAKQLSALTLAKRLAFAMAHKNTDWKRVVFSDRKKFLFWYPGTKVKQVTWCEKGTKPVAKVSSHPPAFNVYAALTPKGMTDVHVVAGTSKHTTTHTTKQGKPARNITAGEYQEVLTKTLLPQGCNLMGGALGSAWVFQQDNDPTHKAAPQVVKAYNKAHGSSISVLPKWPPNSPDLNPIENIWAYVQAQVEDTVCNSFQEFQEAVKHELRTVPQDLIDKLYGSMEDRLRLVISRGGGKTGY
jgi:transposase